ncbi:hypothetical protein KM043_016225 [Ampulex compressa]|nr:hypothetical protein KM043_016225 [Ampulex compressa]
MRAWAVLPVLISTLCLPFCRPECAPDIGQPLDLELFSGKWFMVAGTPVNGKSLSKCGQFMVKETSPNAFTIRYTARSRLDGVPVIFNVEGSVGHDVIGYWQLKGSKRILGPFKHVIVSMDYNSALAMVVCSTNNSSYLPGYKFSMIWSRERSLPLPIFEGLKSKLSAYINQEEILMADHINC